MVVPCCWLMLSGNWTLQKSGSFPTFVSLRMRAEQMFAADAVLRGPGVPDVPKSVALLSVSLQLVVGVGAPRKTATVALAVGAAPANVSEQLAPPTPVP